MNPLRSPVIKTSSSLLLDRYLLLLPLFFPLRGKNRPLLSRFTLPDLTADIQARRLAAPPYSDSVNPLNGLAPTENILFSERFISILKIVMNRLNFSFHNPSTTDSVDAIQRTTFTAPIDLVGKARLTRFKLSEGAFPLCQVPPSQAVYNDSQKQMIDLAQAFPLDLYVAFGLSDSSTNQSKAIGSTYFLHSNSPPTAALFDQGPTWTPAALYIHLYWFNQPARWKKVQNGWLLANPPIFLYNIDDLYSSPQFHITSNISYLGVINVTQIDDTISFNCLLQSGLASSANGSTPALLLSKTFMDLLREPINNPFHLTRDYNCPGFEYTTQPFYPVPAVYTFSPQVQAIIASNRSVPPGSTLDLSTSVSIHLPEDKSLLFPYTAIILIVDEFNNPGERIVVNNPDSTGVVNLSTLSITKLFIIGQSNYQRSDFVYVNDSLQESPLDISLPRQTHLTLRLFFLLKDNSLVPLPIPPQSNFFAQISLIP